MKRKIQRVFISAPFSATHPEGIKLNIDRAKITAQDYVRKGYFPQVPHLALQYLDPNDPQQEMLARLFSIWMIDGRPCDALHYFGKPTEGMEDEIRYALGLGIDVIEGGI